MNPADYLKSRSGLAAIGVLALLAIVSLFAMPDSGKHPLALKSQADLCRMLGEDTWVELGYPATDPVARVPADAAPGAIVCALELDPVPAADRWARVARGDDADKVRRIATVRLSTTATLRAESASADSREYAGKFDQEMAASGWSSREVEGPWSWGAVYTTGDVQTATLAEDGGVVMFVTARGVHPDSLVEFTRSASQRIRSAD